MPLRVLTASAWQHVIADIVSACVAGGGEAPWEASAASNTCCSCSLAAAISTGSGDSVRICQSSCVPAAGHLPRLPGKGPYQHQQQQLEARLFSKHYGGSCLPAQRVVTGNLTEGYAYGLNMFNTL